ncbi:MAG: PLP-dependent aminotransferase family protein, partial [Lachnospiraceae bacterium]|nr:PLP-dependent aminotransferase family protein [Lachnospiraceae bacterium]
LAEENGVSVITVEHAYDLLLEEGYLEARERSGYFVLFSEGEYFLGDYKPDVGDTKRSEIKNNKLQKNDPEIIKIKPEPEPDTECFSPYVYAKIVRKVLSGYEEKIMEKSPGFGTERLRRAIADYLFRSRHIDVSTDRIIIGAGAEYLYGMIVKALGREMVYGVEDPGYHRIEEVYKGDGATVEMLPLGEDGIKSEALKNAKATVLHITPYRSFPTGVTASLPKKMEYLKWSKSRNGILIEDDFESEFTLLRKAEDTLFSLDREGRVIYVNTFTKTIGPNVRIAYMLIPSRLLPLFVSKTGFYACPVPVLEQLVVAELIENGDFERHINRIRRKKRAKADDGNRKKDV